MTRNTRMRKPVAGWYYLLPEVAAPLGGGLIKIGQASTWAAVSVGLAPYVIMAALYAIFVIGYIPAVICYLCSDEGRQDAVDRLIMTSANAIVSLLTLTPADDCTGHTQRNERPRLRVLKDGAGKTPDSPISAPDTLRSTSPTPPIQLPAAIPGSFPMITSGALAEQDDRDRYLGRHGARASTRPRTEQASP